MIASIKFTALATLEGHNTVIGVGKDLMYPGTGVEIVIRSCHETPRGRLISKYCPLDL